MTTTGRRRLRPYPFGPLADAMRQTPAAAARALGLNASATTGFSYYQAEDYAIRAGFHPFEVWPEMALADTKPCVRATCTEEFVPEWNNQDYCSRDCMNRDWRARAERRVAAA